MEGNGKINDDLVKSFEENVDRCIFCGCEVPEGRQICPSCLEQYTAVSVEPDCNGCFGAASNDCGRCSTERPKPGNPLRQDVTGNAYYDYLIHEVQVVCNCPPEKAMAIVSYVNSLGSNPIEFINKLPEYVGQPHPDADEVLQALENIRSDHDIPRYGICFPEGYANRKERRKQQKAAKRAARKAGKGLGDGY